jgi:hypothetical protein
VRDGPHQQAGEQDEAGDLRNRDQHEEHEVDNVDGQTDLAQARELVRLRVDE